jgi:hypothetical protein
VGIFGSKEELDPGFLQSLRPDDKRGQSRLAQTQATIRQTLMPGEQVKLISFGSFGSYGGAVATDRRLLVFSGSGSGSLAYELHPPGLTCKTERRPSDTRVEIHHQGIYLRQVELHTSQPDDYVAMHFKDGSDAWGLCAAIETINAI